MTVKKLTVTGLLSALIFALTMFIKVPVASGYVHFGDALIYVAALLIGSPYAIIAAALGEGLADIAGGYVMYFPATAIIKCIVALLFTFLYNSEDKRLLTKRTALMTLPCGAVTVIGYFIADLIISKAYAFVDIPGNVIQALGSAVVFVVIAAALDRAKIVDKLKI